MVEAVITDKNKPVNHSSNCPPLVCPLKNKISQNQKTLILKKNDEINILFKKFEFFINLLLINIKKHNDCMELVIEEKKRHLGLKD